MDKLIVLAIVGVIVFGIGYWTGWWKRQKLGLIVEKDLSNRLARAEGEISELRCEISGMAAASEVLEELMWPNEHGEE